MTPEQLDHLRRIDAHLASLLAIAEKRTPGEWYCPHARTEVFMQDHRPVAMIYGAQKVGHANAAYIASCAGNAEAGWKATRAAIKGLLAIEASDTCADEAHACNHPSDAADILGSILSAFPNA